MRHSSVVIGVRVFRVKFNHLIEIVFGFRHIPEFLEASCSVVVGVNVGGLVIDSLVVIFQRFVVVPGEIVVVAALEVWVDGGVFVAAYFVAHGALWFFKEKIYLKSRKIMLLNTSKLISL